MGQGELFALDAATTMRLLTCDGEALRMELVTEIEGSWDENERLPCWKTWPEIHHCLTGGTDPKGGPGPSHKCLLGSRHLLDPNGGYMAALLPSEEIPELVTALDALDAKWLRRQCEQLFAAEHPDGLPEEWFQSLTDLFLAIKAFYQRAAASSRSVLFTTDELLGTIYTPGTSP